MAGTPAIVNELRGSQTGTGKGVEAIYRPHSWLGETLNTLGVWVSQNPEANSSLRPLGSGN